MTTRQHDDTETPDPVQTQIPSHPGIKYVVREIPPSDKNKENKLLFVDSSIWIGIVLVFLTEVTVFLKQDTFLTKTEALCFCGTCPQGLFLSQNRYFSKAKTSTVLLWYMPAVVFYHKQLFKYL